MNIENPSKDQIKALRQLWQEAFGDTREYLDAFFSTAFAPERCRCLTENGRVAAALYRLDCTCRGAKIAYLYAIATGKAYRGRGFCRALLADTHDHLAALGYQGALLVPDGDALAGMYEKMGYRYCSRIREFTCAPGPEPANIRRIDTKEYARLRRDFLPEGGVIQEGENLSLLQTQAEFYAGEDFLLAARREEDRLMGIELLGNASAGPGILTVLGLSRGIFRTPGEDRPFAMYRPLGNGAPPEYFGLAFD